MYIISYDYEKKYRQRHPKIIIISIKYHEGNMKAKWEYPVAVYSSIYSASYLQLDIEHKNNNHSSALCKVRIRR